MTHKVVIIIVVSFFTLLGLAVKREVEASDACAAAGGTLLPRSLVCIKMSCVVK